MTWTSPFFGNVNRNNSGMFIILSSFAFNLLGLFTVLAFLGHFRLIFELIFGSFSSIWQRNKQNGTINGMENDVKNTYPREGKSRKMEQKRIFLARHTAKMMKNDHFWVHFCKIKVRVPFFIYSQFQFWEKWKQNEMENDVKMSGKWTKNAKE